MTCDEQAMKGSQPVSLADEEGVRQILASTVFGLWDIVNNLTRLRPSKRERYRVTIFGSARAQPGTYVYDEVKRVAAALAEMGCDIITGGGPGLMQAANEGAAAAQRPGAQPLRRHPRRAAVRAGGQSVRRAGVRAPDVFHAAAPLRPGVRRLRGGARRDRHRAGTDDDLATLAGPARPRHAADPRRQDVGRPGGLGQDAPARPPSRPLANPEDMDDPALRGHRRRGDRPAPRASCPVAGPAKITLAETF